MLKFEGEIEIPTRTYKLMEYCDKHITIIESIYSEVAANQETTITVRDDELLTKLNSAATDDEIYKILEENRLLESYYIKKTFLGLLQDFCNYMTESMAMVKKFKPQIGLTLARKPLIDDMYYISKLLVNSSGTISEILHSTAKQKEITKKSDFEIAKATEQYIGEGFGDLFHDIRYSDDFKSLKASCDLASHIVTNKSIIRTNEGELNFIYLDNDSIREYCVFYCEIVSMTLMYSTRVILKLYEKIYGAVFRDYDINELASDFLCYFKKIEFNDGVE